MKTSKRLVLLVGAMCAGAVFAQSQTDEVEMKVGVDGMGVMPDGFPGMQMKVKVKQTTTTTQETVAPAPGYAPAPAPVVVYRDCGTGRDPGCALSCGDEPPMDRETFTGFVGSLRNEPNEILRHEQVSATVPNACLTAAQLGVVLDLFTNEITRFEVAKESLPRSVNPKHALGFSTKFKNGLYAKDYVAEVSKQRR